jgi:hypothetical protein
MRTIYEKRTHLLILRQIALDLAGITTLPTPGGTLENQFVTCRHELFWSQYSTA